MEDKTEVFHYLTIYEFLGRNNSQIRDEVHRVVNRIAKYKKIEVGYKKTSHKTHLNKGKLLVYPSPFLKDVFTNNKKIIALMGHKLNNTVSEII